MKKIFTILSLLLALTLTGCGYEETKEYPVESTRYYTETIEEKTGRFTTTTNTLEYIEFVYIDSDGQYHKLSEFVENVKISNTSKVVEGKGDFSPTLYLTLEDYNKLLSEK